MMIHVSDIIHSEKCPKYAWNLYRHIGEPTHFFHMVEPFNNLWKRYFHVEDAMCGNVGDTNEMTLEKMQDQKAIVQARFSYRECRTKIPLLIKKEDGYQAIYPILGYVTRNSDALRYKLDQLIAKKVGISITSHQILLLSKDYIREKKLDLDKLFTLTDHFYNRKGHPSKPIEEVLNSIDVDLDEMIDETVEILEKEALTMPRNRNCTAGRRCVYYDSCFDDSNLPDDSVLFFTTSQHKLEDHAQGIEHIKDIPLEHVEGSRLQYAQILASKEGLFIDRQALSTWLSKIQKPISYLDFEWDTFGIPPYEGMKPFDVLCFQYSLHIEREGEPLDHKDFFGTGDCREAFIQSLLENLPSTGSILVYNMEGAEKLRLIQLAQQFPKYEQQLRSIWERMIDLSKPFETGIFYDNRMRGHYSLKNILPIFTDEVSYRQLAIHDGLNAVHAYRIFDEASPEEKKKIAQDIRNYCRMDTFAEVIAYHGLLKRLEEEEHA